MTDQIQRYGVQTLANLRNNHKALVDDVRFKKLSKATLMNNSQCDLAFSWFPEPCGIHGLR